MWLLCQGSLGSLRVSVRTSLRVSAQHRPGGSSAEAASAAPGVGAGSVHLSVFSFPVQAALALFIYPMGNILVLLCFLSGKVYLLVSHGLYNNQLYYCIEYFSIHLISWLIYYHFLHYFKSFL